MTDPILTLSAMRRPGLLIKAARFGLADYRRERDLKRVMRAERLPRPSAALDALLEQEKRLEETRKTGDGSYSIARHIEVLIALMAESSLIPRPARTV